MYFRTLVAYIAKDREAMGNGVLHALALSKRAVKLKRRRKILMAEMNLLLCVTKLLRPNDGSRSDFIFYL